MIPENSLYAINSTLTSTTSLLSRPPLLNATPSSSLAALPQPEEYHSFFKMKSYSQISTSRTAPSERADNLDKSAGIYRKGASEPASEETGSTAGVSRAPGFDGALGATRE